MSVVVRTLQDSEVAAAAECQGRSFGFDSTPEGLESRRAVLEVPRSHAAWDGDTIVGTAGIYSYEMGVPGGGSLPCAGVTMVSVLPTHRRQRVLTSIMDAQLNHVRDHGDPIAALWATESVIYGRFGYGMAAQTLDITIDRQRVAFGTEIETPGSLRFIELDEARESWPAVYDELRRQRPGVMSRNQAWWTARTFADPADRRGGFTARQLVNYEFDGEIRGYLAYRKKMDWTNGLPTGTTRVEQLVALTNDAYAALWQYALSLDLVSTIVADHLAVDEPLFWMLADPRRLERHALDSLWLRIVDVERTLAGRAYSSVGELVLEVTDGFLSGAGGTFLLSAGPGGATCVRTTRAANISLGIAELGALYLGGVNFTTLARAGRISGDEAAIRRADVMFSWPVAPWCPETF